MKKEKQRTLNIEMAKPKYPVFYVSQYSKSKKISSLLTLKPKVITSGRIIT